jgi:hypothetical protein
MQLAEVVMPEDQSETLGVLWGAQEIADFIERPVRDVYYLLQQGHLDADKCGDLWVSTRSRLRRQFEGGAPPKPAAPAASKPVLRKQRAEAAA